MRRNPKERITVTLDPAVLGRVDALAAIRNDSRSAVIERILANGVEEEEKLLRTMENPVTRVILETITTRPRLMAGIAAIVGQELSAEDAATIAENMRSEAQRGRDRQAASRHQGDGPAVEPA